MWCLWGSMVTPGHRWEGSLALARLDARLMRGEEATPHAQQGQRGEEGITHYFVYAMLEKRAKEPLLAVEETSRGAPPPHGLCHSTSRKVVLKGNLW